MGRTLVLAWCVIWLAWMTKDVAAQSEDGFFRFEGKHLHLTTDIDDSKQMETIVSSFDAAVPQWFAFWGRAADDAQYFHVDGFVMENEARFRDNGLLPRHIGQFPFGTADGPRFWIHRQPSEYYTRHLALHEGVHVMMFRTFDGAGSSWFMEGTAEMLSVHSGEGLKTVVNRVPIDRAAVPEWGRFKLIAERRAEGKVPNLKTVMRYPQRLNGSVEAYSWSWAAVMMLSQYPETRDAVLKAAKRGRESGPGFTKGIYNDLRSIWPIIEARWAMMNLELDYGFDWSRESIRLSTDDPRWTGKAMQVELDAASGWQSVGAYFPSGAKLEINVAGDVQLAQTIRPWISLPDGISIRHHRGHRIGKVIACVLPIQQADAKTISLPEIVPVGSSGSLSIDRPSWVLLRVNEAGDKLGDNTGNYRVTVAPLR